jgi:hypothetical protein
MDSDKPMFSYMQVSVASPRGIGVKIAVWMFLALIVVLGVVSQINIL